LLITYNGIIGAKNDVENNKSTIQTVLQNRYDLIPNLVEVVKQYTTHEQKMIEQVTTMRAQLVQQKTITKESAKDDATLA
jgi:LemA protein